MRYRFSVVNSHPPTASRSEIVITLSSILTVQRPNVLPGAYTVSVRWPGSRGHRNFYVDIKGTDTS